MNTKPYNPHVKRTFGEAFKHDLAQAKSGRMAPGGRTDGYVAGLDLDSELRHDIRQKPEHKRTRHHNRHYPTTRMGRILRGIKNDIERNRP